MVRSVLSRGASRNRSDAFDHRISDDGAGLLAPLIHRSSAISARSLRLDPLAARATDPRSVLDLVELVDRRELTAFLASDARRDIGMHCGKRRKLLFEELGLFAIAREHELRPLAIPASQGRASEIGNEEEDRDANDDPRELVGSHGHLPVPKPGKKKLAS